MYLLRCPKPGQREGLDWLDEKLFVWWFVVCVTLWSRQHLVMSNEPDSVRMTGSHLSPGSQRGQDFRLKCGFHRSSWVPGMLRSLPHPLIKEGRTLWAEHVGYVVPKALLGLVRGTSRWAEWPLWVWCPQLWLLSRRRLDLEWLAWGPGPGVSPCWCPVGLTEPGALGLGLKFPLVTKWSVGRVTSLPASGQGQCSSRGCSNARLCGLRPLTRGV